MMEDKQFLEFFRQMIREEIGAKNDDTKIISVAKVAEKLDISVVHLTKNIMHTPGFPKAVRLTVKGDLRFYEHEINEYILGLRKEA
ncbi:hypothetical protein MMG00_09905 [Ignatzschineria rhizosphaerae]|uniref:DNA-binding protein n=1 Tax=Ignatzschineria rhizosphaerae TaxID=2923279 RepID=A0ABY3WY50_9GAMM|nr:hypothetical protein [Ignatzschineria rhizosphaerae]UNM95534.1 hypothetical protein MMG00_09905 [Ignatzschineria rhizosphaerae]